LVLFDFIFGGELRLVAVFMRLLKD